VAEEIRPVPKTLLAVDDSATMRKVLEITFSSDDFRVVTAANAQAALAKMSEEPSVVVIDTIVGADDGYALCGEIRRRDPSAAILLLSSRHNPYDAARGREAGADDFMDKPFDTQQMVDKVKKTLAARESGAAAAPAPGQKPAPSPSAPSVMHAGPHTQQGPGPQRPGAGAAAAAPPDRARARTLMFGDRPSPGQGAGGYSSGAPDLDAPFDKSAPVAEASPAPPAANFGQTKPSAAIYPPSRPQPAPQAPPAASRPAAPPVQPFAAKPAPAPTPKAVPATMAPAIPAAAPAAVATVASGVNGQLAGKLSELGLSAQQVDAVMALSREVVEKVVWEVVPVLAETLIKEEIARLTKEG
jgi:CheY-like chemotaxis protein